MPKVLVDFFPLLDPSSPCDPSLLHSMAYWCFVAGERACYVCGQGLGLALTCVDFAIGTCIDCTGHMIGGSMDACFHASHCCDSCLEVMCHGIDRILCPVDRCALRKGRV